MQPACVRSGRQEAVSAPELCQQVLGHRTPFSQAKQKEILAFQPFRGMANTNNPTDSETRFWGGDKEMMMFHKPWSTDYQGLK